MNFMFVRISGGFDDVLWSLLELKYKVIVYTGEPIDPTENNESHRIPLYHELQQGSCDAAFSYLFVPEISDVCQQLEIPYITWIYDSPSISLFHQSIYHPVNHIFIFDESQYQRIKSLGVPHCYHMSLAANTTRFGALVISDEDERRFSHDISFVGKLYDQNPYNENIGLLPENFQLELKQYLVHNLCNWHHVKEWPVLSDALTSFFNDQCHYYVQPNYELPQELALGNIFLSRKLCEMDRITVLNTLAQSHTVDLYTKGTNPNLVQVINHGPVSYNSDMAKVFYLSKINLNITLPSIETGIPQRIFDIMGCGGFLLTNYQAELEEEFVIGEDLEVFHDLDELQDKVAYYLSHEQERMRIAMNGYQKVMKYHTTTKKLSEMIHTVFPLEV